MRRSLQDLISINRVGYCLDCGKCGAVCPITRWETRCFTSPRLLIEKSINGRVEDLMDYPLFWSCLLCKNCSELCPSDVHFIEFIRDVRSMARTYDRFGDCTHSEMIQTWGRMMTNPDLHQSRLQWLSGDLGVSKDSDTIFFVGCLPYFDPLFQKIGVEGVEIAKAAIKILNHLGIEPQVSSNERCCGHDQLWEGDVDTFRALATLNLEMFMSSGAKRIVTTCPECARTIKMDYPKFVGNHGMEVMHLSELLVETDLAHSFRKTANSRRITYQDPCHLGRHLGVYDAPRKILTDMGYDLSEMRRNRNASLCCGSSCWRACGQVSKNIQVDRLEEARSTGAELLVTACLKCQIHLKCAQNDPIRRDEIDIEIQDLTTLVAENL
jgi:heterodisulfide reductase subunit D